MSELDDLEEVFASRDGIPISRDSASVPPDFRDLLPALRSDPGLRDDDRQARVQNVRSLLDQLDNADNNVVKNQKRRVIRAELNALRQLEAMGD